MGDLVQEKAIITISPANSLSGRDWERWFANTLRFFLPVFSIYLGGLTENMVDGFVWSDLIPNMIIVGMIILYIANSLQDLITKYVSEKKYVNGEKL